jgi:hypothetical protein
MQTVDESGNVLLLVDIRHLRVVDLERTVSKTGVDNMCYTRPAAASNGLALPLEIVRLPWMR